MAPLSLHRYRTSDTCDHKTSNAMKWICSSYVSVKMGKTKKKNNNNNYRSLDDQRKPTETLHVPSFYNATHATTLPNSCSQAQGTFRNALRGLERKKNKIASLKTNLAIPLANAELGGLPWRSGRRERAASGRLKPKWTGGRTRFERKRML